MNHIITSTTSTSEKREFFLARHPIATLVVTLFSLGGLVIAAVYVALKFAGGN